LYLFGGIIGVLGFVIEYLLTKAGVPSNNVALAIVILCVLCRVVVSKASIFTCGKNAGLVGKHIVHKLPTMIVPPAIIGALIAIVVFFTGNVAIGFYVSALSLICLYGDNTFPVTHHITMVSGTAAAMITSSLPLCIAIAIVFAIVAQLVCEIILILTNYAPMAVNDAQPVSHKHYSHLDGQASSIAIVSLVILIIQGML
jgi:hypothetical protein